MTPTTLADHELPGFFTDADAASARGQRLTLVLNVVRLAGAVLAAAGAAFTHRPEPLWPVLVVGGFAVALVAEILLLVVRPERDWYAGRALAESAKTLAWRYAVGADPFGLELEPHEATEVMRARLRQVDAKGSDRVVISVTPPLVTPAMTALRARPLEDRRAAYLAGRTLAQHRWYVQRARHNQRWALGFRMGLIAAEVVALVVATVGAVKDWDTDAGGLVAALVAAGAAFMSLKQYESLAAAYATTARELALQAGVLEAVDAAAWPAAVADAEEAISREHTMWLATRLQHDG